MPNFYKRIVKFADIAESISLGCELESFDQITLGKDMSEGNKIKGCGVFIHGDWVFETAAFHELGDMKKVSDSVRKSEIYTYFYESSEFYDGTSNHVKSGDIVEYVNSSIANEKATVCFNKSTLAWYIWRENRRVVRTREFLPLAEVIHSLHVVENLGGIRSMKVATREAVSKNNRSTAAAYREVADINVE
jgi:hypothetical protein